MRRISNETVALAYEIKREYRWPYERIAEFIGCDANNLNQRILRSEREGLRKRKK